MPTAIYMDTARLGRMCRGARLAEQDFGRLVGRLGSSLYFERFLCHGYRALTTKVSRRVPRLKSWTGMRGFRITLGRFIQQPPELPTYFFSQSSALIHFAAECLFANSRRILITDLAWPPYVDVLRRVAKERRAQLIEVQLRDSIRNHLATKSDVLDYIMLALQQNACDGVFLSDITYEGTRLPVEEVLAYFEGFETRPFTVIDGAQAFHQRPLNLKTMNCDLYLTGSQKWFGAYHPLRMAFAASNVNLQTIETTATNLSKHSNGDALYRFTRSLESADFASFGETVNLSALIAAAGALRQAEREAAALHDPWEVLRTNAQSLASWVEGHGWFVRQHASLGSGILLLTSSRKSEDRSSIALKQQLGLEGIIASVFPDGSLRLSMPRFYLPLSLQTKVLCALKNAAARRCVKSCYIPNEFRGLGYSVACADHVRQCKSQSSRTRTPITSGTCRASKPNSRTWQRRRRSRQK